MTVCPTDTGSIDETFIKVEEDTSSRAFVPVRLYAPSVSLLRSLGG